MVVLSWSYYKEKKECISQLYKSGADLLIAQLEEEDLTFVDDEPRIIRERKDNLGGTALVGMVVTPADMTEDYELVGLVEFDDFKKELKKLPELGPGVLININLEAGQQLKLIFCRCKFLNPSSYILEIAINRKKADEVATAKGLKTAFKRYFGTMWKKEL